MHNAQSQDTMHPGAGTAGAPGGHAADAGAHDLGSVAELLAQINATLQHSSILDSGYREVAGSRARRISELVRERDRLLREKQQLIGEKRTLSGKLASEEQERKRLQAQNKRLVTRVAALKTRVREQQKRLSSDLRQARERAQLAHDELVQLAARRSVRGALKVAGLAEPIFDLKRSRDRG